MLAATTFPSTLIVQVIKLPRSRLHGSDRRDTVRRSVRVADNPDGTPLPTLRPGSTPESKPL